jgi:hypothetical protein
MRGNGDSPRQIAANNRALNSPAQRTDCMKGEFYKDWNIPVGKATMFSLP